MRIAFCGKGGSGKSTMASLTARMLASKQAPILVVDGNINQHLGEALGFGEDAIESQPKLGMDSGLLFETVRGTNPRIPSVDYLTESTPAGNGSGFIHFDQPSPIYDHYQIEKDGVRFMAVGSHEEAEVGTTCFHKFTGVFGIFLNHFIDQDGQYLIGDMCAGADPFASSGLATRFDAVVLVVEPTLKSTGVYDQCKKYAEPYGTKIFVVGNKVENEADEAFIREKIGDDLIACFGKSEYVRNLEKGIFAPIAELEPENAAVIETILERTSGIQRDWAKYQENGLKFHKQAAESWANAMYGADLMEQYDPEFSYESLLTDQKKAA
ncbi:MAG TPA: adenylyl-sulfate kinase [Micavibrio sp.]|nr:adenylyl-sulfate kinase [Micavibrio sp.]HIL28687.1 adenylyl-sulfate kinase [Micavibrio sp.]